MNVRRVFVFAAFVLGIVTAAIRFVVAAPAASPVVVVPIHGTIDEGTAHLVQRSIADAQASGAKAVVLDIDTLGGLRPAALEIRDAMVNARIPVDAFIANRAASVGALVALASARLEMAPGSTIGGAEPIPNSPASVSALKADFVATAVKRGRNGAVAAAMVDANANVAGLNEKGSILTLRAEDARESGIAQGLAPTLPAAIRTFGLADLPQRTAEYTFAESLARFVENPAVGGILLALGFLGLMIEMQTLHGIAGTLGAASLALFFGTHVYTGFGDGLVVALAIAGVAGIMFELHVLPGHGVFGIGGVAALVAAVFLAFGLPFFWSAVQALAIAIVLSVAAYAAIVRVIPENAFMRRFAFTGSQGAEYVAASDYSSLVGLDGFASSYLRPAGVATVGGQRIDVLTDGDFVTAGTAVRVTRVEGARIFVESLDHPS